MDVGGLWQGAEITSRLCNVIQSLRSDYHYTREDAVKDLIKVLEENVEPLISGAFIAEEKHVNLYAIEQERERRGKGEE